MVRFLLLFIVLVTGLLTTWHIFTTSISSWNVVVSLQIWSSFDADTTSVDKIPLVRGPQGIAGEIRDPTLRDVCRPLLVGDPSLLDWPASAVISAAEYIRRANNCDRFRSDLGYFVSPEDTTDEERRFPIAFSVLTYENLEQTARLLRLIYRPHNVYCIHVDAKSPDELRNGLEAIANCFDNVFVAKPSISVQWATISVVNAEILCMRQLLDIYKRWKYLINLVGRDFPLRTNYELVKILRAYNGANDVEASRIGRK